MKRASLGALSLALFATGASLAPIAGRAQEPTTPQKSPIETELTEINRALFFGGREPALKYAARIKALGKEKLSDDDRETWLGVARDAALRLGDRAWLESLKDIPDSFSRDMIYKVLLAYGQLSKADLDGATKTLDGLKEADKRGEINVREQRRMTALRARIAQLRGGEQEGARRDREPDRAPAVLANPELPAVSQRACRPEGDHLAPDPQPVVRRAVRRDHEARRRCKESPARIGGEAQRQANRRLGANPPGLRAPSAGRLRASREALRRASLDGAARAETSQAPHGHLVPVEKGQLSRCRQVSRPSKRRQAGAFPSRSFYRRARR